MLVSVNIDGCNVHVVKSMLIGFKACGPGNVGMYRMCSEKRVITR